MLGVITAILLIIIVLMIVERAKQQDLFNSLEKLSIETLKQRDENEIYYQGVISCLSVITENSGYEGNPIQDAMKLYDEVQEKQNSIEAMED